MTFGYWAYDQDQGVYYWVPGAWVQPPEIGLYWTPGYWGWQDGAYVYYPGYWGPTVGFYGGVNYGHGYWGNGYGGGRWDNGHFAYNTAANNVSGGHVHNTYSDKSAVRSQSNRVSFNGGTGGVQARPTSQEQEASQQSHVQPTAQQQAHFQTAAQTRSHQVKVNANKPATANATQPAGSPPFTEQNVPEQKAAPSATTPPVQHEPQVAPDTQPKPETKPPPASPSMAPPSESHAPQGSGGGVNPGKPSGGPASHPQGQPPANAQPKSDGQGKPDSNQNNGQH